MEISKLKLSDSVQIPVLRHYYQKYLSQMGVFVEVGAYDGESWSNTSCLADLGWTGFYIEPIREYAEVCAARHLKNNVSVFELAINDGSSDTINIDVRRSISTTDDSTREAYSRIAWSQTVPSEGMRQVKATSLDNFLLWNKIPENFNLLVVDIEGGEENLFKGFSLCEWAPRMLIVELCDYSPSFDSFPDLQQSATRVRELILDNKYKQVYADEINTIFVL